MEILEICWWDRGEDTATDINNMPTDTGWTITCLALIVTIGLLVLVNIKKMLSLIMCGSKFWRIEADFRIGWRVGQGQWPEGLFQDKKLASFFHYLLA